MTHTSRILVISSAMASTRSQPKTVCISDCHRLIKNKVITLGGGHEVAWASSKASLSICIKWKTYIKQNALIKISQNRNLRSASLTWCSLDLREFESDIADVKPSSGTPLIRSAITATKHQWPFHYACLGVSAASNTKALFNKADQLGVVWTRPQHDPS